MADAQLLSKPDDSLIKSKSSLETDREEIQAVRQAHSNPVDSAVSRPLQPEVRQKKSHTDGDKKPHDHVPTHEQRNYKPQGRRKCETRSEKNISMGWLAIAGQHKPTNKLWVRFCYEQPSNQGERFRQQIHIEGAVPGRCISRAHRPCGFLQ